MASTTDERGLVRHPGSGVSAPVMPSGMQAVALLSDDEFAANLSLMAKAQERTRQIQKTLMHEGRDYGLVPGTNKPTLLKPGAEVLTLAYGFVARVETDFIPGDGQTTPAITYNATCYIHVGTWDGPIVAIGHGSANSWERKYRYRQTFGTLICPGCGKPGLIHTKERGTRGTRGYRAAGYWHPRDGRDGSEGCGENFPEGSEVERITGETVENPDPYELLNTIEKMSDKRAHVGAILRATGTSGLFTVEEEDADKGRERPDARSRREFNEWVAEVGLDPVEVMDLGKALYPDSDLRKLAVWERTAWRAAAERDLLFASDDDRKEVLARIRGQQTEAPPEAPVAPTGQQAAPAPQTAPTTQPRNVTPPEAEREAVRRDAANAPAGPGGVGRSAEAVAAAARDREAESDAGRVWTADELADLDPQR